MVYKHLIVFAAVITTMNLEGLLDGWRNTTGVKFDAKSLVVNFQSGSIKRDILSSDVETNPGKVFTKGFEINGYVPSINTPYVIFEYYQGLQPVTDSAVVINGKFRFSGILKEPCIGTFSSQDGEFYHFYLIENSKMSITQKEIGSPVLFTGSKAEDDSREFSRVTKDIQDKYFAANSQPGILDTTLRPIIIRDQIKPLYAECLNAFKKYITEHPDQVISLYKVLELSNGMTAEEAKRWFYLLDKKLQHYEISSNLAKRIKRHDQYLDQPAANFIQKSDQGQDIRLDSFRGKYVFVDFWASWCVPCRAENPNLIKAYRKYNSKGFEIIGVSLDENEQLWKAAIKKDKLPWTQVSELNGWRNTAALKYYITSVPSSLLIDPTGKIIDIDLRGPSLEKRLEKIFDN